MVGFEDPAGAPDPICRGGSAVVSPLGEYVAGPRYSEEGMLVVDLDQGEAVGGKSDLDVVER